MSEQIIEPRLELQRFLRDAGLTYADAARFLHCSLMAVSHWVCGRRVPKPTMRQQIAALTLGRIKPVDWETSEERLRRHARALLEARAAASRPKRVSRKAAQPGVVDALRA